MSKLDQILGYLDRPGVTEVLLGVGRPIMIQSHGAYQALTANPVSRPQLDGLLQGTALAPLLADGGGSGPGEVAVGPRRVRAEVRRRGDEVLLRIEAARGGASAFAATTQLPRVDDGAATAATATTSTIPRVEFRTPSAATATTATIPRIDDAPAPVAASPVAASVTDAPVPAAPVPAAPVASVTDGVPGDRPTLLDERCDVSTLAPLLRAAREHGASDLHVNSGRAAMIRVRGTMQPLDDAPLSAATVDRLLLPLLGPQRRRRLASHGYVDLALDVEGGGRVRANVSRQRDGLHGAFRLASPRPQTLDELRLPRELAKVVQHHQGLVIIAGPSGHGKTTTLGALVDLINTSKPAHIITIEDPVEIHHPRKKAVLSQREVGSHTLSFVAALKGSLREDPDVIVIGELRDRETVEIALTAAETGHLVLATMSTPSAAKTIDRVIDMFPPDDQAQVRVSLAGALRAVVAQRLLPAADGARMVPAVEVVTGVLPLVVLIRDDKLYQLPNLMQRGRALGMIRLEDSLQELRRAGAITDDVARPYLEVRKDPREAATQPIERRGLFGRKGGD